MPLYMLDTDTVSHIVRGRNHALDARLAATTAAEICISAVTRGELLFGLHLKDGAHRLSAVVEQVLMRIRCLPWDDNAATHYAALAAALRKAGTPIGPLDTMIAGHAASVKAILVTNNLRHFSRVAGLRVENWCQDH